MATGVTSAAPDRLGRHRGWSRPAVVGMAVTCCLLIDVVMAAPGDAPLAVIAPADRSTIVADLLGIPLRFACPPYHLVDGTPVSGAGNYSVAVARTVSSLLTLGGPSPLETSPGQCEYVMQPSAEPGYPLSATYYWQVLRSTGRNDRGEPGPVSSFTVRLQGKVDVRPPRTMFVGYLARVPVISTGLPAEVPTKLQRKRGTRWVTVPGGESVSAEFFDGPRRFLIKLPLGRQLVRAVAETVVGRTHVTFACAL